MEGDSQQKQCQNCHKLFPEDKIDLHEAYCRRNIKKCPKCDKMIDINEQQAHENQQHSNKTCQVCNQSMSTEQFTTHPDKCFRRPVICEFCQNTYAFLQLQKHKSGCGSRTRACQVCQRFIMIKDITEHESKCQRRVQQRRNQVSQDAARLHNRIQNRPSSRQRQISQNVRQKRQTSVNKNQVIMPMPKPGKIKPSHMIGPETIKPVIDPVPISIRLAMKMKQQQRMPLQSKN